MNHELIEALRTIEREKGISFETLLEALANALVTAYKKLPSSAEEAVVEIDIESGEMAVYAQEFDEEGNLVREWDDTPKDFGRIAAMTAKQVILQRIREAERDMKYEEYAGREGDIVTGIIQQTDQRYTLIDLGRVEALLPLPEQVPSEHYEHGARLKAYIVEVRRTNKGPQIVVSRTHPGLVKRLFELEVPEIAENVVQIKALAREPGHRTKIAVASTDENVDPVGACVGARGSRVRLVVNELRGEKVDIVPFSDDPHEFVAKALSPAKVREVRIHEAYATAEVIVPDYQLSLAIGKEGQNARLAARLTGWRIDIKSETQLAEQEANAGQGEWAEGSWVENDEGELVWIPAGGGAEISASDAGYDDVAGFESDGTADASPDAAELAADDSDAEAGAVHDDSEASSEGVETPQSNDSGGSETAESKQSSEEESDDGESDQDAEDSESEADGEEE
ncbi:MAG: transcription termination/antitermination protein NusA [Actinobacteria bacterium]|nr:transcription termination/antitermination protein NusA [Actinomycetota bacterium]MCB9388121.1 transcription termination/antitermination protein NusA [Acidimicrobiia bacterium]